MRIMYKSKILNAFEVRNNLKQFALLPCCFAEVSFTMRFSLLGFFCPIRYSAPLHAMIEAHTMYL